MNARRNRRHTSLLTWLSAVLTFVVMSTSVADLVGHDHAERTLHSQEVACVLDHERATGADARTHPGDDRNEGPFLDASDHDHQHHCLGCRGQSQRSLSIAVDASRAGALPCCAEARPTTSPPRARQFLPHPLLRGPPQA